MDAEEMIDNEQRNFPGLYRNPQCTRAGPPAHAKPLTGMTFFVWFIELLADFGTNLDKNAWVVPAANEQIEQN